MATTYRVRISNLHKEKVIRTGQTLAQAQDLKHRLATDTRTTFLIVTIEEEEPVETPATAPKAITAADQEARVARAFAESGNWSWREHDCSYICEVRPGDSYLVSESFCTCPDWEHRVSKTPEARCKHQTALGHKLIELGAGLTGVPLYPTGPEDLARTERLAVAA